MIWRLYHQLRYKRKPMLRTRYKRVRGEEDFKKPFENTV
ncbi:MAG: hypothetical protein JWQ57_5065 [Mucilaginibacter sp.]|nr:hypothetical protein [Mucilaginibacter sp.]